MPTAPEPMVERQRLGDRYALYGEIASGGMATVHFGRLLGPVGFARTVAIKRLHAQLVDQPEFVRMFVDEARLAARVRHPNVVATIDVVATEGQLFLVMEYVQGESLAKLARACTKLGGRVPRRIVAAIMLGILHGLHAAHEAKNEKGEPLGIVHRDVSPQNVLVGTDGVARVIDFGIARAAVQVHTTGVRTMKGKPAYMAPEQIQNGNVTRLTDIYAASVIFWELLTGERLFYASTDKETIDHVLAAPVQPPSAKVPTLLPALDDIVLKGLARDPAQRFPTARDMARAIEECIAPASLSDVGEWVEKMAGDVLADRERRLADMEGRGSSTAHDPASAAAASPSRDALRETGTGDVLSPVPDLILPKRQEASRTEGSARPLQGPPPSIDPLRAAPSTGDTNRDVEFEQEEGAGGRLELDAGPGLDTIRSAPMRPSARRFERAFSEPPPAKRRWLRWFLVLVVLVAVGVGGAHELPGYVLKRCIAAAARQGVTLVAQRISLRPRAIVLSGVKATIASLPWATASVDQVEIVLDGMHARGIQAHTFELALAGPVGDVSNALSAFRAKTSAEPIDLDARSGHVTWTTPFGDGTQLEAWDTSLSLKTSASGPDDLHASAASAMVRAPRAAFGPWRLGLDHGAATSLLVAFDPDQPDWATARLALEDGAPSLRISIPRSPLSRVGVPRELLGDASNEATQIEASVDATPSMTGLLGKAAVSLHGVRTVRGMVDLKLDLVGTANGPGPVVGGTLGVGSVPAAQVTGTATVAGGRLHFDLASTLPCSPSAAPKPHPRGKPLPTVTFTFDSGELSGAPAKARSCLFLPTDSLKGAN
jgi:serine/threonine protein kinase